MKNKLIALAIAAGSIVLAQAAANTGNYMVHEIMYSGGGTDEGAVFSAAIVGAIIWAAVCGLGFTWAYRVFNRD